VGRSSYVIVGEAAIISVKSLEEAYSDETRKIAEEILATHKRVKGVYAKIETAGTLRVQKLIHVAGVEISETWHRENGIDFHVTLGRVYINPRLSTEHLRIAKLLDELHVKHVLDAFAGIGGYAFNIAVHSKNVKHVVANDINYFAYRDMLLSAARNRRRFRAHVTILNDDAKLLPLLLAHHAFDAIIMDNPQFIEEFLELPCSLAASKSYLVLFFVAKEDEEEERVENLMRRISCLHCKSLQLEPVLDYAPRKYLYSAVLACEHR